MIQLTTSGVRIARDDAWAAQQQEFAQRHCVVLEGFLDESILCHIPRMLEQGEFDLRDDFDYEGQAFARELTMRRSEALPQMLFYFLNQPPLREAIAELTGCEKTIRTFVGRCFKHHSALMPPPPPPRNNAGSRTSRELNVAGLRTAIPKLKPNCHRLSAKTVAQCA